MRSCWFAALALAAAGCGPANGSLSAPTTPPTRSVAARVQPPAPSSAPLPTPAWDVPWVDRPAPDTVLVPLPAKPLPHGAPACLVNQLKVVGAEAPGDTQDDGVIVEIANRSSRSCLLTGRVHATLYGPGAAPVHVVSAQQRNTREWTSYDMAPGQLTMAWFRATDACLSGPAKGVEAIPVTDLSIAVPTGGTLSVAGLRMPRSCGGPVALPFMRPEPAAVYPRPPFQGAKIYLTAPVTAGAGSTLDYVVTLANPTGTAIPMTPCPGYAELLISAASGADVAEKSIFGLNCAGRRTLAPYERLRYEMRIVLPSDASAGPATLTWQFAEPASQTGRTTVDVVRD